MSHAINIEATSVAAAGHARRINADINAILARPKLTPMERYELLQRYEWSLKDKIERHCMVELLLMRCAGLALGETPQVPDVPAADEAA